MVVSLLIGRVLWEGVSLGREKGIYCKVKAFSVRLGCVVVSETKRTTRATPSSLEQVHRSSDPCKTLAINLWQPRF